MELKDLYIFEWLSEAELSYFALITQNEEFKAWSIIIKEWDESNDKAYIIESWEVEVFLWWEKISTLWVWDIFWEIALITHEPRTATVKANWNVKVITLSKENFIMLYEKSWKYDEIRNKILKRIKDNFYGIKR